MARPSGFTQKIADIICARLIDGESLRSICRDAKMPSTSMVMRWLNSNERFREQYAHARERQADAFAEELLEISDDGTNDWMERRDDQGGVAYQLNGEHVQRSRLRVDTRKWLMARMAPKKYGDKVLTETTGADGGPVEHKVSIEFVRGKTTVP